MILFSCAKLYRMNLPDYLKTYEISAAAFADALGVSSSMVSQWLSFHRPITPEKCVLIELNTDGKVTRKDLRPNDWRRIWPELAEKDVA